MAYHDTRAHFGENIERTDVSRSRKVSFVSDDDDAEDRTSDEDRKCTLDILFTVRSNGLVYVPVSPRYT